MSALDRHGQDTKTLYQFKQVKTTVLHWCNDWNGSGHFKETFFLSLFTRLLWLWLEYGKWCGCASSLDFITYCCNIPLPSAHNKNCNQSFTHLVLPLLPPWLLLGMSRPLLCGNICHEMFDCLLVWNAKTQRKCWLYFSVPWRKSKIGMKTFHQNQPPLTAWIVMEPHAVAVFLSFFIFYKTYVNIMLNSATVRLLCTLVVIQMEIIASKGVNNIKKKSCMHSTYIFWE